MKDLHSYVGRIVTVGHRTSDHRRTGRILEFKENGYCSVVFLNGSTFVRMDNSTVGDYYLTVPSSSDSELFARAEVEAIKNGTLPDGYLIKGIASECGWSR